MSKLTYRQIVSHFKGVNADCIEDGFPEEVVPFSDVDYYAAQILVEFEEDPSCPSPEVAREYAIRMSKENL